MPVETGTYWGRRAILDSVAWSRERLVAVGARSGGAHGNPRVTSFRMDGDILVDVPANFVQYGGVTATNVGPIAGGPTGWLITGNRTSGPGVCFTDDLESSAQGAGWVGKEWMVVGSGARTGRHLDPDPLACRTCSTSQCSTTGGRWPWAVTSSGIFAAVSTGERYELWRTDDGRGWRQVDVPLHPQTAGDHTLVVAAGGDVLVVGDAGDGGHVRSGERVSP